MANLWERFKDKLTGINTEPERTEPVEHDIVMIRVGNEMEEVTADDPQEGQ